ncbi:M4 family metallopeptidase [Allorhizobium taibaishanense]|uniref:Neutral metalloproteinase n=1 Tax=Allorhizobium taibaishanense TaxID=887144 RepID=A0A1Q8ZZ77_9HYPH|nr:M4 family metallopeptidase [Allorhizobium taibaishanense]MBB4007456.1 Zn-dependent metalloprotease [Allorhizobium taibaishanense]OLP47591.1 peptidase [Allorhizobium taibaishanense]
MCRYCQIIPEKVLIALSHDEDLPADARERLTATMRHDHQLRQFRDSARQLVMAKRPFQAFSVTLTQTPDIPVYTCNNGMTLPGVQIADPGNSSDPQVKTTFNTTSDVERFYRSVFNRNSIDGNGMTILSSVHYGRDYNNAFWNGSQMAYGDGDGQIFTAFCDSADVVGHELTHGVTQYTLGLDYENQAGGLNESLSDAFGSLFKQWVKGQSTDEADWLIGNDILGPAARQKYTCLRDMADPTNAHCMGGQIAHFRDYRDGMDPHETSGIANHAFYLIATRLGGKSWDKAGPIWYDALTRNGSNPDMTMAEFAGATKASAARLFPGDTAVAKAVDSGWADVGIALAGV